VLEPACAVIPPGGRQTVSVVFHPEGSAAWSAVAGLDVSERDVIDSPGGIPYELGGESCIPGKLIHCCHNKRFVFSGAAALKTNWLYITNTLCATCGSNAVLQGILPPFQPPPLQLLTQPT
jgi:hypothetical protein